ncbi:MAG: peptidoglycan DD-metalloendopeptidase family protein [Legionella sp.]|nr:peptidoglycan DD-metalloendopeptidase family protein [Legionella sp.]
MVRYRKQALFLGLFLSLLMQGCGMREGGLAPVEESTWYGTNPSIDSHVVKQGETLYSIAFRYDQDYHRLAALNHLKSPYGLKIGQVLHIKSTSSVENFASDLVKALPRAPKLPLMAGKSTWLWPAQGRVMRTFSPSNGRKGIDIAGKKGSKIRASSAGIVAYAGDGLPGYGHLVILKHDTEYLTAYGNNQKILVHSGQYVKQGQVIAEMGVVNRRFWGVHFEVRRRGEPVNPLNYLKKKT